MNPNDKNAYGVPLHACNGVKADEHYWTWLGAVRQGLAERRWFDLRASRQDPGRDWLAVGLRRWQEKFRGVAA